MFDDDNIEESMNSLKASFASRDKNKTGHVSVIEFTCILVKLGGQLEQIDLLAKQFAASPASGITGSMVDYKAFMVHMEMLAAQTTGTSSASPHPDDRNHHHHHHNVTACDEHDETLQVVEDVDNKSDSPVPCPSPPSNLSCTLKPQHSGSGSGFQLQQGGGGSSSSSSLFNVDQMVSHAAELSRASSKSMERARSVEQHSPPQPAAPSPPSAAMSRVMAANLHPAPSTAAPAAVEIPKSMFEQPPAVTHQPAPTATAPAAPTRTPPAVPHNNNTSVASAASTSTQHGTEKKKASIRSIFNTIDGNRDGLVSADDIGIAFAVHNAGVDQIVVDVLFEGICREGEELINFESFATLLSRLPTDRIMAVRSADWGGATSTAANHNVSTTSAAQYRQQPPLDEDFHQHLTAASSPAAAKAGTNSHVPHSANVSSVMNASVVSSVAPPPHHAAATSGHHGHGDYAPEDGVEEDLLQQTDNVEGDEMMSFSVSASTQPSMSMQRRQSNPPRRSKHGHGCGYADTFAASTTSTESVASGVSAPSTSQRRRGSASTTERRSNGAPTPGTRSVSGVQMTSRSYGEEPHHHHDHHHYSESYGDDDDSERTDSPASHFPMAEEYVPDRHRLSQTQAGMPPSTSMASTSLGRGASSSASNSFSMASTNMAMSNATTPRYCRSTEASNSRRSPSVNASAAARGLNNSSSMGRGGAGGSSSRSASQAQPRGSHSRDNRSPSVRMSATTTTTTTRRTAGGRGGSNDSSIMGRPRPAGAGRGASDSPAVARVSLSSERSGSGGSNDGHMLQASGQTSMGHSRNTSMSFSRPNSRSRSPAITKPGHPPMHPQSGAAPTQQQQQQQQQQNNAAMSNQQFFQHQRRQYQQQRQQPQAANRTRQHADPSAAFNMTDEDDEEPEEMMQRPTTNAAHRRQQRHDFEQQRFEMTNSPRVASKRQSGPTSTNVSAAADMNPFADFLPPARSAVQEVAHMFAGKCSQLLTLCNKADPGNSGSLPTQQMVRLLRTVQPQLNERQAVNLCASPSGSDRVNYVELVGDLIVNESAAPPQNPTDSHLAVMDSAAYGDELGNNHPAEVTTDGSSDSYHSHHLQQPPVPPHQQPLVSRGGAAFDGSSNSNTTNTRMTRSPSAASTASTTFAKRKGRSISAPRSASIETNNSTDGGNNSLQQKVSAGREKMKVLLHSELSALQAAIDETGDACQIFDHFVANDVDEIGYLDEDTFRTVTERLFASVGKEAPKWLCDRLVRMGQQPFQASATSSGEGAGNESRHERNARLAAKHNMDLQQLPMAERKRLCDYNFVMAELGLLAQSAAGSTSV